MRRLLLANLKLLLLLRECFELTRFSFAKINTERPIWNRNDAVYFFCALCWTMRALYSMWSKNLSKNYWERLHCQIIKRNQDKKFSSLYSNIIDLQQTITLSYTRYIIKHYRLFALFSGYVYPGLIAQQAIPI